MATSELQHGGVVGNHYIQGIQLEFARRGEGDGRTVAHCLHWHKVPSVGIFYHIRLVLFVFDIKIMSP